MVVDAKTGRTLHAENEDALRHPASVTKVMTLYLLFEQLERGRIALDTPLHVSANAAAPGALEARPEAGRDDRGRGRDPGAGDEVGQRRRRRGRRESRRLRGGLRRADDAQGARARHEPARSTATPRACPIPSRSRRRATSRSSAARSRTASRSYYRYFQTRVFNYAGRILPQPQQAPRPGRGRRRHQDRLHPRLRLQPDDQRPRPDDRHIVAVVLGGRSGASRDQTMALARRRPTCRAPMPAPARADGRRGADRPAPGGRRRGDPRRAPSAQVDATATVACPGAGRSRSTSPPCARSSPTAPAARDDHADAPCAGARRRRSRSRPQRRPMRRSRRPVAPPPPPHPRAESGAGCRRRGEDRGPPARDRPAREAAEPAARPEIVAKAEPAAPRAARQAEPSTGSGRSPAPVGGWVIQLGAPGRREQGQGRSSRRRAAARAGSSPRLRPSRRRSSATARRSTGPASPVSTKPRIRRRGLHAC